MEVQFRYDFGPLLGSGCQFGLHVGGVFGRADQQEAATVLFLRQLALKTHSQELFLYEYDHKTDDPEQDDHSSGDNHLSHEQRHDQFKGQDRAALAQLPTSRPMSVEHLTMVNIV